MSGYCGGCEKYYEGNGFDHLDECPGSASGLPESELEEYRRETGDGGLIQAPDGFDWQEAQDHLRRR